MAELAQDPSKFDILKWIANNWAQKGAHAAASPYHMVKELQNTPVMGPGGEVNPSVVDQSARMGLNMMGAGAAKTAAEAAGSQLFGAGTELGAFKPSLVGRTKATFWTPEKVERLKTIEQRMEGKSFKEFAEEFRRATGYEGSNAALQTAKTRLKTQGGLNTETGAASSNVGPDPYGLIGKSPEGRFQWAGGADNHLIGLHQNYPKGMLGRDRIIEEEFRKQYPNWNGRSSELTKRINKFEESGGGTSLGSNFGNFKPRLNTESPGEAINWLQAQKPVDEAWVRNWAKEAGVPVSHVIGDETKYLHLTPQNPPKPGINDHLVVRLPQDADKHLATNILPPRINDVMDTGLSPFIPKTGKQIQAKDLQKIETSVVNKSGLPYSNPEAADAWLKYNTQQAPGGGNWLIPEEMAPRPHPGFNKEAQGPQLPPNWSPNQLKLLSSGYTPADIIQILKQQQVVNGQET